MREFFRKLAGDDMEVDWMELKEILDYAMRKGIIFYLVIIIIQTFKIFNYTLSVLCIRKLSLFHKCLSLVTHFQNGFPYYSRSITISSFCFSLKFRM